MSQMAEWNMEYKDLPGKKIGVVQGKTYEQIKACYEYMDKISGVDMIAISFDYSYYTKSVPHPNKYVSWMLGRVKLLGDLLKDGIINENKPHHLLGCGLPQEFSFYSQYPWIYSLDTSNPVVHGIKGIEYGEDGLWSKESQKLFELINFEVEDTNKILYNISKFKMVLQMAKRKRYKVGEVVEFNFAGITEKGKIIGIQQESKYIVYDGRYTYPVYSDAILNVLK